VLRRTFGPKRDEVTGEWRKLHNEELNDPYSSSNTIRVIKSRRMRWLGHVARMRERRIRGFGGEIEGKRPFGRPRGRWENNIKIDLQEVGWGGGTRTGLIWLKIGTVGGHLRMRKRTFGFHRIQIS